MELVAEGLMELVAELLREGVLWTRTLMGVKR